AVRLLYRRDDRLDVEWTNGARVNDFNRDALLLKLFGRLQSERYSQRARHDGRVRAFALHVCDAEGNSEVSIIGHFALEAVHALLFKKDHRIVVADRALE